VDKLTLAALEATLSLYRDPDHAVREIPALAMLTAPAGAIRGRAESVARRLASSGFTCLAIETEASVGGGAFPTARIPSWSVSPDADPVALEARLRSAPLPVIGRISEGRLLLDLRSVPPSSDDDLVRSLSSALGAS
jgi:L-seryl-tRNA(Ser) seleniumtransferase